MLARAAPLILACISLTAGPTEAAGRRHSPPVKATADEATPGPATPDDDLYRRRGYGMGGLAFGLGRQGGLDQAGACADLAFARPRSCGPRGGYGVYGNGLGYGF